MLILSRIFPGSDFGGLETLMVVRKEIILDKFLQILERPLLDGGQYIQRWVILYIAGVLSSPAIFQPTNPRHRDRGDHQQRRKSSTPH